jgi:hypothetical protein
MWRVIRGSGRAPGGVQVSATPRSGRACPVCRRAGGRWRRGLVRCPHGGWCLGRHGKYCCHSGRVQIGDRPRPHAGRAAPKRRTDLRRSTGVPGAMTSAYPILRTHRRPSRTRNLLRVLRTHGPPQVGRRQRRPTRDRPGGRPRAADPVQDASRARFRPARSSARGSGVRGFGRTYARVVIGPVRGAGLRRLPLRPWLRRSGLASPPQCRVIPPRFGVRANEL